MQKYNEKRAAGEIDALPMESLYEDYRIFAEEGWDKEDGRVVPFTKEVLRLPGRGTLQGGLDIKA